MGRVKKNKPRRERPVMVPSLAAGLASGEKIIWNQSPARALLSYPDDVEMQEMIASWVYWLVNPDGSRIEMQVGALADSTGETLSMVATALVELEDAGLSSWDGPSNELRMRLGAEGTRASLGLPALPQ